MELKFANWEEMYDYLVSGQDLYNFKTGDYIFVYNDADALCRYNLSSKETLDLVEKSNETGEYWGAYLGIGGHILDEPDYDDDEHRYSDDQTMRDLYLKPSYDYCKFNFSLDGWINTKEYTNIMFRNEKEIDEPEPEL